MKSKNDSSGYIVYPPVLMAIFLVVALLFGWKLPVPLPFPWWMKAAGWVAILSGLGLAFSAVKSMKQANTTFDVNEPVTTLVSSGPFKISRNPIYLAYVLVVVGLPLVLGFYWGVILSPVALDAYNRLVISKEEAYLQAKFGEKYLKYKATVRRWL